MHKHANEFKIMLIIDYQISPGLAVGTENHTDNIEIFYFYVEDIA